GLERTSLPGVVPVVEVAAAALEGVQRVDGRGDAIERVENAQPAEVVSRERRQQIEADVGRRRAVRDHGLRVLLEVVRRYRVVLGTDEGLEEVPGPSRRPAQRAGIVVAQRLRAGVLLRQADPPPDQW